jgi:hypothetical protein
MRVNNKIVEIIRKKSENAYFLTVTLNAARTGLWSEMLLGQL